MYTIDIQILLASQYLAAAGISFLPKEADDSHTNLGFNAEGGYLETHPLSSNDDKLILNYKSFSLEWKSKEQSKVFKLDGATHKEVVTWISETSKAALHKEYVYDFHYELAYAIEDTSTFKLEDTAALEELEALRVLAQHVLEQINAEYSLNTSIRVWPHHFDSGIYSEIPNSDLTVGLGLAIPDSLCKDHYLYITGYKNGNAMETKGLEALTQGTWVSEGFKGGILTTKDLSEASGLAFFNEAIERLK